MDTLNEGFQMTPFKFELVNVTHVLNDDWFNNVNPNTTEGTYVTLVIILAATNT